MAEKQQPNRPPRLRDVESLAATLFARVYDPARGRTPDAVARECLAAARVFYRAADEPEKV